MSRIGKKPIAVPQGVQIAVKPGAVHVKGPKGELEKRLPDGIKIEVKDKEAHVTRLSNEQDARAKHGLMRAQLQNMVVGVTQGFERKLEINGVGYKAELAGQKVTFALGFSHPVVFELPKGIAAKLDKNVLILAGVDKELVGQIASKMRSTRPPEPYKGKGVKYLEETIKRKVGKTGATA